MKVRGEPVITRWWGAHVPMMISSAEQSCRTRILGGGREGIVKLIARGDLIEAWAHSLEGSALLMHL